MIFKNLLVVLFGSIFLGYILNSCVGQPESCLKVNLSKDEETWFNNYRNGDTIFFSNIENEIDTFVIDVDIKPEYTQCNRFELGPYIYASQSLEFKNLDDYSVDGLDKNYFLGFNKIGQDSTDIKSYKYMGFFDLSTGKFFDFSRVPKQEFTIPKTGQKIEVYVYTKNYNCSNVEGGIEIMQEFAISKEYGLIWYKTLKGDTYNRVW